MKIRLDPVDGSSSSDSTMEIKLCTESAAELENQHRHGFNSIVDLDPATECERIVSSLRLVDKIVRLYWNNFLRRIEYQIYSVDSHRNPIMIDHYD